MPTQARLLAVRVLERVQRAHAYADLSLHHYLAHSDLSPADRALATELVYGTLRWRGRLDFLLGHALEGKLEKLEPPVLNALRIGVYQLLFSDRIPASAAVDESVRCVRALGLERATGLVNAVLRRLAREHDSIPLPSFEKDPIGHLSDSLSLPRWIAERWLETYGPDSMALAQASNERPPLTIRANVRKQSRDELLAALGERFPDAERCRVATAGIRLGHKGDAGRDPLFLAGCFTVQDEAAQLVVAMLDPQPGDLVLDVCAAPGGKTTAIAELLGDSGGVLALDRHPGRLGLVARATRRLELTNIHTLERDAERSLADLPTAWLQSLSNVTHPRLPKSGSVVFDRVLADVPCTGLGTLRRNPDARWRVTADSAVELARCQLAILSSAAAVLRPGGILVYSTCTLLSEENEKVVDQFLQNNPGFRLSPPSSLPDELLPLTSDGGFLRCHPHIDDMDGFFAARLERIQ